MKSTALWMLLVAVVVSATIAQERKGIRTPPRSLSKPQNLIERKTPQVSSQEYADVFRSVERGINEGNVGVFSQHFSPQVYVSLPNGEKGYFSGNQAYYVLQSYLSGRRIQSFTLKYSGSPESAPYASGQGRSEVRGSFENIQVYVSLSKIGDQWMVNQLTIY